MGNVYLVKLQLFLVIFSAKCCFACWHPLDHRMWTYPSLQQSRPTEFCILIFGYFLISGRSWITWKTSQVSYRGKAKKIIFPSSRSLSGPKYLKVSAENYKASERFADRITRTESLPIKLEDIFNMMLLITGNFGKLKDVSCTKQDWQWSP